MEQDFILVREQLPQRKAAAAGEPAKGIGEPRWQAGQVVEGQHMAVVGSDHEVAFLVWQRSGWCGVRVNESSQNFRQYSLCRALLA